MNKWIISTLLVLILIPSILFAIDTGKIAGRVSIKGSDVTLEGASVYIKDTNIGTYTLSNGSFVLKNVPLGNHIIIVSFIGYKKIEKEVEVKKDEVTTIRLYVEKEAVDISGMTITANRAVKRETPIAFTNIDEEKMSEKYTTEDVPQLLEDVPGLFSTNAGLGEGEITMRGFDADKIQILINGIPVNDPESQKVYWSNWSGLTSNLKSVQVQRGAGTSLYGSGAFGGSVNIETIGSSSKREFTLRTSGGFYTTDGKVADGKGGMQDYNPKKYSVLLKYDSGNYFNERFNFSISAEKKAGDSYVIGTNYDGYSFGLETETNLVNHTINTSFVIAPQEHNQARTNLDRELAKFLGREHNPTNHPWQENKFCKPQFSIRDKWLISDHQHVMSNMFITSGKGGGTYIMNNIFDVETGEISYQDMLSESSMRKRFGRYAMWVYEQSDSTVILEGYDPIEEEYTWRGDTKTIRSAVNFLEDGESFTWKNNSVSDHFQIGFNSYFHHEFNEYANVVVGGEIRRWNADHYAECLDFRYFDPIAQDSIYNSEGVKVYDEVQRAYDYTSTVTNLSCFFRTQLRPTEDINLMFDGQYASYTTKIEENKIHFFDFGTGEFTDGGFYQTKNDLVYDDSTGTWKKKFDESDYERTYSFFSPKVGINYNITKELNILSNFSIAYKEPRSRDWYDRDEGPGFNQIVSEEGITKEYELEPEKATTIEFGAGYEGEIFNTSVNYYITKYTDKIESVTDDHDETKTINAGKAKHQGVELSINANFGNFDFSSSATFSKNRWEDMNVKRIFYVDAEDVIGKVVPYSPEQMMNGALGYTFEGLPSEGSLRLGLAVKWWDRYYGSYTNDYQRQLYYYDDEGNFVSEAETEMVPVLDADGIPIVDGDGNPVLEEQDKLVSSKLPAFFELNGSVSYKLKIGGKRASIRLNVNNITNRDENYSKAYVGKIYGRNDNEDRYYPLVTPSPLMNFFVTTEIKF